MRQKIFGLVVLLSILAFYSNAKAAQSYVFGVHPFKSPATLMRMFKPLMGYLEAELGAEITFRTARNYEAALKAFVDGEIDISYMGPALYANLDETHPGLARVAAAVVNQDGTPVFRGVIVAREDSSILSIEDLENKKFAFGDRESTLSCYMPAHMLLQAGILDSVSYTFVGSHDNVAQGVLAGVFDAGGLKPGVARNYLGKGLKVVAESTPVYEHLIVVGPNVEEAVYQKIRQALITARDPQVYQAIKGSLTGFAVVESGNYDNLKKIIKEVDQKLPK